MSRLTRQLYKVSWFFRNYRKINSQSILVNGKGVTYNSDGLLTFNNSDCLLAPRFANAYNKSLSVNDWRGADGKYDMRWRYYFVCWLADHVKNLDGDFVECGVYKGGYTLAVMEYINFSSLKKTFWLFDTFEGLALDHLTESEIKSGLYNNYKHYENTFDWVKDIFTNRSAEIIKGTVPETLTAFSGNKICYLSIDMNCVEPEIAAAEFFWDKLVSGGVMILDDYGFKPHIDQKRAFDVFAKNKNVQILQLPTGQAIIFKP